MISHLHNIIDILCRFFLVVMILSVSYVVFGRFVLNNTPGWGEELGLFCMIWFSLLSVPMAFIDKSHLKMSLMEIIFKGKDLKLIDLIIYAILLGFSLFMIFYGMKVSILTWPTRMPGMQISRGLLYFSVPVAGVFNTLILLLMKKEYLW
jgi:TRAP-type transport system small permease protein